MLKYFEKQHAPSTCDLNVWLSMELQDDPLTNLTISEISKDYCWAFCCS